MSNVISFPQSPLSPYLGPWVRDPLSVSRNKVVRLTLGADGLKKLWACDTIEERQRLLAEDPVLDDKYRAIAALGQSGMGGRMEISLQAIVWKASEIASAPTAGGPAASASAANWVFQVARVAANGKKVIVHATNLRPEKRGKPVAFVLRMSKQWLLMSEQYSAAQANIFPRSPVFRYYRSS
jgi:hypothetical protein